MLYGTNAYVGVINVITKVWDSSGVAGVSYGAFNTATASAAGGKTIGNLHVSGGVTFSRDGGWSFSATDSIDIEQEERHDSLRPLVRPKSWGQPQRHVRRVNVDVFYARAETPHLSNSSATTSWPRYGLSEATQAMVDVGYTHKLSTRWTSSLHATYNHFLDLSDFGEIGYRDTRSNDYLLEWANDLSVTAK